MFLFAKVKPYCTILIILICFSGVVCAQEYTVVAADRLAYEKQRMAIVYTQKKQRTDWYYPLHSGMVTAKKYKDKLHFFTQQGLIDETLFLDEKGIKKSIAMYDYTSNGLPKSVNEFSPLGYQLSKIEYVYTLQGTLFEVKKYKGEADLLARITFSVDELVNAVTQRDYGNADTVRAKVIYHYTNLDSGMLTKIEEYIGENNLTVYYTIERDEQSRIESEEYFDKFDQSLYHIKYHYLPNGKLANKERIEPTGKRTKVVEYNYSVQRLVTGVIQYDRAGRIGQYYKYSYE